MEHLQEELNALLAQLPNREEFQERLDSLVSVYPFNEYEYVISTLLAMDVLTLDGYHELRERYVSRNQHLRLFEMSSPTYGTWAQDHLKALVPGLLEPSDAIDPDYSRQYDFFFGDSRIEVKASRAVDRDSRGPLYVKAITSDSAKRFDMNFQQLKPSCCDVFVWVAVWRDVIRYWVLSSYELMLRSLEELALRCLPQGVIPAKAGIHYPRKTLDSRFRGSDGFAFMTLTAQGMGSRVAKCVTSDTKLKPTLTIPKASIAATSVRDSFT